MGAAEPSPSQPRRPSPKAYGPQGPGPTLCLSKASFAVTSPAGPVTSCAGHIQQLEPKTVSHRQCPRMRSVRRRGSNQDSKKSGRVFTEHVLRARRGAGRSSGNGTENTLAPIPGGREAENEQRVEHNTASGADAENTGSSPGKSQSKASGELVLGSNGAACLSLGGRGQGEGEVRGDEGCIPPYGR